LGDGTWVFIHHNVARAKAYLHAKFHLEPSNRLATIHWLQTGQDRQQSNSIGRTILQTVGVTPKRQVRFINKYNSLQDYTFSTQYTLMKHPSVGQLHCTGFFAFIFKITLRFELQCISPKQNLINTEQSPNNTLVVRPFVKWFTLCYRPLSCLSVLSTCNVGVLWQMVGRIKMKLGKEVGLGPGHIALDGDPASPQMGHSSPLFSVNVYMVAHLSYC